MAIAAVQPHVLKNRIGAARIPHNVPVRARLPNVTLAGSRRNPAVFFCYMGNIKPLDPLPADAAPCPNLEQLEVALSGAKHLRRQPGDYDLIGIITCNGRIDLKVEQAVPCGAPA